MKKIITSVLLVAMLVTALSACGVRTETNAPVVESVKDAQIVTNGTTAPQYDEGFRISIDETNCSQGTTATDVEDMKTWYGAGNELHITSAAQLLGFFVLRGAKDEAGSYYDFAGKTVYLDTDVVAYEGAISELYETTTGNVKAMHSDSQFKGTFDGQGHVVSGLYLWTNSGIKGMFGSAGAGACIKNLTLVNSAVKLVGDAKNNLGVFFGRSSGCGYTFENVYNAANIVTESNGANCIGGFVGGQTGSTTAKVNFTNCVYAGTITAPNHQRVGGFVGDASSSKLNDTFTNCVSKGNVTGASSSSAYIGRFYKGNVTFTNCVADGTISGDGSVGGFVGYYQAGTKLVFTNVTSSVTGTGVNAFIGRNKAPDTNPLTTDGLYYDYDLTTCDLDGATPLHTTLKVLGTQTRDNGNGTYDIRFVFGVKNFIDAPYFSANVTMQDLEAGRENTKTLTIPALYREINSTVGTITAEELGTDYLGVITLKNLPEAYTKTVDGQVTFDSEKLKITIDLFTTDMDGTEEIHGISMN